MKAHTIKAHGSVPALSLPALLVALALPVHAHDPSEHMEGAEQPDCSAMTDMDHPEMDPSDPVARAMRQKCMQEMHGETPDAGNRDPEQDAGPEEKDAPAL